MSDFQTCLAEIESLQARGIHRGLETMAAVLDRLGNPHQKFKSIHVAGTNGKGSTCFLLSHILAASGYKTGLTISPHLHSFTERIQINNTEISSDAFVHLHQQIKNASSDLELTYFEWGIVMAFLHFAESQVDMAVIETGLGGRWDATNILNPLIGVLTNVSLDHTQILGETCKEILVEKMQIFKPGILCVSGPLESDLENILLTHCRSIGATLRFAGESNIVPPLEGSYQKKNAALVLSVVNELRHLGFVIEDKVIKKLFSASLVWPGRMEYLKKYPHVFLDAAHNPAGIDELVKTLQEKNLKPVICFSALNDRPFKAMAEKLYPQSKKMFLCAFEGPRTFSVEELKLLKAQLNFPAEIVLQDSLLSLIKALRADELLLITGSLQFVALVRSLLN